MKDTCNELCECSGKSTWRICKICSKYLNDKLNIRLEILTSSLNSNNSSFRKATRDTTDCCKEVLIKTSMLDDSGINGRYKLSYIKNGEIIYMQMTTKWGEQHMLYKDIIDEVWRVSSHTK